MAFKNQNVTPSKANGVGAQGTPVPLAHMPANNVGMFPVKLGAGKASKFGVGVSGKAAQRPAVQKGSSKVNMPAHNNGQKPLPLGTTKHAVGTVPHYLRAQ